MRFFAESERHTGAVARRARISRRRIWLASVLVVLAFGTTTPTSAQNVAADSENRSSVHTLYEGQIVRLYRAVLDRSPDDGGFDFWVRRLRTGSTIDDVAAGFVASREFELVYGEPDDGQFVELLYRNVLNRAPDEAGREFWVHQIETGLTRVRVVVLFAESSEFVALSRTGLSALPPFAGTVSGVTADDLGSSWRNGCPVAPAQLRRLDVSLVNFDGQHDVGTVIVHEDVAEQIVLVFEQLYEDRYPVARMVPVDQYDSDDLVSMDANNTSAFNCRAVTGGTGWSRHAFGRAIDINPVQNPYLTSSQVLPLQGAEFVDRTKYHPAMIYADDVVVRAFASVGWRWGGNFNSIKDWHHFDTE